MRALNLDHAIAKNYSKIIFEPPKSLILHYFYSYAIENFYTRRIYTWPTFGMAMSIITAYNEAWDNGNVEALRDLIHDDCVFNPHVGGITMSKSDILGFVGSGNTPKSENNRILFENDEVGVAHSIVHFANNSDSEAVMAFMRFKDGKIILMETGATPLSDDYKLIGSE